MRLAKVFVLLPFMALFLNGFLQTSGSVLDFRELPKLNKEFSNLRF